MNKVSEKTTLKIYTLGQFSIVRHGVTLRHTRKAPHKPLLLSVSDDVVLTIKQSGLVLNTV
jgi:hypothetical protein